MSSATQKPIAIVTRDGRTLTFRPPHPDILAALTTRRIAPATIATSAEVPMSFASVRESGGDAECITRAGFQPLVQTVFERAGFQTLRHITDALPRNLPLPDLSRFPSRAIVPTLAFLDFVRTNLDGTVRFPPGHVDFVRLIAEACLAYPTARIVVATESKESGRRIARCLCKWLGRVPAFDCRPRAELLDEELPKVSVSTFLALAELDVEFGIDLLFLPRISDLVGTRADLAVNCAHRARVFGFAPLGMSLSPFEEDIARAVLGFAELFIPGNGLTSRPIQSIWSSLRGNATVCGPRIVDVLRKHVWGDPLRSRRVVSLALLLESGNVESLSRRFPDVAQSLSANLEDMRRNLVVCDNGEHVSRFVHQFPGPCLVLSNQGELAVQLPENCGRRQTSRATTVQLVATRDALAGGRLDLRNVDAIIVAGANPNGLELPLHAVGSPEINPLPLTVIEFADRRHPLLRRWTRSRIDDYARRDILNPGANAVMHRVDRYLASRHGGRTP
jgi:hypothetical protein